VQTKDGGKHAILPVAGQPDHAGVPAYLPRESDTDMRRDGPGHTAQAPVDERGRLHGAPEPHTTTATFFLYGWYRRLSQAGGFWSIEEGKGKSWVDKRRSAQLRRQDKSPAIGTAHVVGRIEEFATNRDRGCWRSPRFLQENQSSERHRSICCCGLQR